MGNTSCERQLCVLQLLSANRELRLPLLSHDPVVKARIYETRFGQSDDRTFPNPLRGSYGI
jgi:hypothetical protein